MQRRGLGGSASGGGGQSSLSKIGTRKSSSSKKKCSFTTLILLTLSSSMILLATCNFAILSKNNKNSLKSNDDSSKGGGKRDISAKSGSAGSESGGGEGADRSSGASGVSRSADTGGNSTSAGAIQRRIITREIEDIFLNDLNPKVKMYGDNATSLAGKYHVIFSTGCSTFQDWQSYVFFYHAMKSGQKGQVTRIASGCSKTQAKILRDLHNKQIEIMAPGRFHLHLTPDYSKIGKDQKKPFKYYNKPFGVLHWLQHSLGYPNNTIHDDCIFVLCDPDMLILRPFTNNFTNVVGDWLGNDRKLRSEKIKHGIPFGQQYGFHAQWMTKTNISEFVLPNEAPSPVLNISFKDAREQYAAGPPYMATGRDFYAIVKKWVEFVPYVYEQYPLLLAEMFAYCLAAAHLRLPHQLGKTFMLSDVTSGTEGWRALIQNKKDKDVCDNIPDEFLPNVLHYCQRYIMGKYMIGKHKLPNNFISCESPLLKLPPTNVARLYNFAIEPATKEKPAKRKDIPKLQIKRTAFMLCYFMRGVNDAATYYKQHHCSKDDPKTNYNTTLVFHENMEIEEDQLAKKGNNNEKT